MRHGACAKADLCWLSNENPHLEELRACWIPGAMLDAAYSVWGFEIRAAVDEELRHVPVAFPGGRHQRRAPILR
tara:strand:- start:54 stop:275 length:222 start_codon:yes stop_codon:yes gene_type:complete